jgi:hypothetical protein
VKDAEEEESSKFSDTFANPKYTSMMGTQILKYDLKR